MKPVGWFNTLTSYMLGLAALAAIGLACPKPAPPVAKPPAMMLDGAPYSPPDGPATCLDVCRNGQALGCSWAGPTPAGASCLDVCANNQNAGIAPWDLNCRARKTSCAAVDTCQ